MSGIDALGRRPGEKRRRLFETFQTQPPRELEAEAEISYWNRSQPLEKSRFGKINASKR
jgi:hypothetical protein